MSQDIPDVTVTITADTKTPTQQGFGTVLLATHHNHYADLVRTYTELSGVASDGFGVYEPGYLMAQRAFSQDPRPKQVKIGKLPTGTARTFTLTVTNATAGDVNTVTLTGKDGIIHTISRTIPGSSTTTAEAAALVALIDTAIGALGDSANVGAVITVTPTTAGDVIVPTAVKGMNYADTSAAANYATALNNIVAVDNDWYGLTIEHQDAANIEAAAAWVESNKKLAIFQTADTTEITTGASVVGAAMKASAYKRSLLVYSGYPAQYLASGWLASMLTFQPGEAAWKFKTVAGVTSDALTATQITALEAQRINYYTDTAGINVTRNGYASDGTWADITVGLDWTEARMKEAVFGVLANAPKVPYTDKGMSLIAAPMRGVLKQGVRNGLYVEDSIAVMPPLVADVPTTDKQLRVLNNMKFAATLQGAVQTVNIRGTVSV
jgi:hypothetical protein